MNTVVGSQPFGLSATGGTLSFGVAFGTITVLSLGPGEIHHGA
jgi:hypothetical protein